MRQDINWEQAILNALADRKPPASICPSEVARKAAGADWRDHMQAVRQTAVALAKEGLICISQGGLTLVDLDSIRGAIRLGHPPQAINRSSPKPGVELPLEAAGPDSTDQGDHQRNTAL